jgi:UPF0755 protein
MATVSCAIDSAGLDNAQLLQKIGADEAHPEGLFFPDTYLFSKGASDLRILKRAYQAMRRHLAQEWAARDPPSPTRTPYEALIMASIVEKETGRAEERDMIRRRARQPAEDRHAAAGRSVR